jgi:hypothetical protein
LLANELFYKQPPEQPIDSCDAAWTEHKDASVTLSEDNVDFQYGTGSIKLVMAGTAAADTILATNALAAVNLALYGFAGVWMMSSVQTALGDLQLLLSAEADCAAPLETLPIPALAPNVWTWCEIPLTDAAGDTAIISVGVKLVNAALGAFTLHVDRVTTYNQAVQLPIKTEGVSFTQELLTSECLYTRRDMLEPVLGNISVDGKIETELAPYQLRLFTHMLGACTGVTGDAPPYTYTFKVSDLPPGLFYEKGFTDIEQYFQADGERVDSFTITIESGKITSLSLSLAGAHGGASFPSSWDPAAIVYPHLPFTSWKSDIKESATEAVLGTVTTIKLDGKNDLDTKDTYVLDGTGERYSEPSGKLTLTGTLTILFTDTVLYNKAIAGTPTKLVIDMWNGTGSGLTQGNEKLTLTIDELLLKPKAPEVSGPKGIKVDLDFQAYYLSGADNTSFMITVLLPNNTTLY